MHFYVDLLFLYGIVNKIILKGENKMDQLISTNELISKLKEKAKEIEDIYNTLLNIKKVTGKNFEIPELKNLFKGNKEVDLKGKDNLTLKPDEFFRKSQTKSAAHYLSMVGHASHLDDIFNALANHGVRFKADGKKVLYSQLIRSTKLFSMISGEGLNSTFGLVKWYPAKKQDKKIVRKGIRMKRRTMIKKEDPTSGN